VSKSLLRARVNEGDWQTKVVADSRMEAAGAASPVVHELTKDGHRRIGVRVVRDEDVDPRRSPREGR
jgi:hypothetical protein